MNNQDRIKEMLAMQDKLNQKCSSKDWRTAGHDHAMAIFAECGELITELGFKWWKQHEPDYNNVRIELVDIWHFILNYCIVHGHSDFLVTNIDELIKASYKFLPNSEPKNGMIETVPDEVICEKVTEWCGRLINKEELNIQEFLAFCLNYGLDFAELYWFYMMKNTLNALRQNEGYKDGSYIKDWNGIEDSIAAVRLWEDNKEKPFSEFYSILEKHYRTHIKPQIILPA
jgi:hypothetical protein